MFCRFQTVRIFDLRNEYQQAKVYGPNENGDYVTRFFRSNLLIPAEDYFTTNLQDACFVALRRLNLPAPATRMFR